LGALSPHPVCEKSLSISWSKDRLRAETQTHDNLGSFSFVGLSKEPMIHSVKKKG